MTKRTENDNAARVLVVDDEPLIRWSLHAELEERGVASTEVDGIESARRALSSDFDLVVLDQLLPDGDGLTFLTEIRRDRPALPVVVLTAHGSVTQAVEAMKRGAYHYLCKSVEPAALLAVIDEALAARKTAADDHPAGAHGANGGPATHAAGGDGHGILDPGRVSLPPEGLVLDEVERDLLEQALARTSGNRSRAARLLGITRNQIRYRIRKFGLEDAQGAPREARG